MIPSPLEGWDLNRYRDFLRTRAQMIRLNPKVRVRFDESDLVQETLLKAADPMTSPCRGQTERERLAWLEQIQNTVYLDRYRAEHAIKRDVKREQEMQQVLDESTFIRDPVPADREISPLEQLARNEKIVGIAEAIQQLPPDQRDAVIAIRLRSLTAREAAEQLGKSPGQVAGLYQRAVTALRKQLRGYDDHNE